MSRYYKNIALALIILSTLTNSVVCKKYKKEKQKEKFVEPEPVEEEPLEDEPVDYEGETEAEETFTGEHAIPGANAPNLDINIVQDQCKLLGLG